MCYHYSQAYRLKKIAEKYKTKINPSLEWFPEYHVNGFDSPKVPVVTENKELNLFQWGLIPSWVKTAEQADDMKLKTLNARSETIFEKPSFQCVETNRCIVPASGFFEWKQNASGKQPYYIYPSNDFLFSFAGIYDAWRNTSTGNVIYSCSIVTVPANSFMEEIHNVKKRMPMMLTDEQVEQWLSENMHTHWDELKQPIGSNWLKAHPISNKISRRNTASDDAALIKKINIPEQKKLF